MPPSEANSQHSFGTYGIHTHLSGSYEGVTHYPNTHIHSLWLFVQNQLQVLHLRLCVLFMEDVLIPYSFAGVWRKSNRVLRAPPPPEYCTSFGMHLTMARQDQENQLLDWESVDRRHGQLWQHENLHCFLWSSFRSQAFFSHVAPLQGLRSAR